MKLKYIKTLLCDGILKKKWQSKKYYVQNFYMQKK